MTRLVHGLIAIVVAATAAVPAMAHVAVASTSIAQNATLTVAPETFTVSFSGKTVLATVALEKTGADRIPLTYAPSRAPAASFTIPLPKLSAGHYTLTWRTMSSDGHVVTGAVKFSVAAT